MNIWINRAVAFILYFVAICIAEKLNLRPAFTFTFAAAWLLGMLTLFLQFLQL